MEELSKLPRLAHLEINSIDCTDAHIAAIVKLDLQNLWLFNSLLDDAKLKRLAAMSRLEYLNISVSQLTDEGLRELQILKSLKYLDVKQTRVTREGVAEFQKAVPGCQIFTDWDVAAK